jgi:hypothetical protein
MVMLRRVSPLLLAAVLAALARSAQADDPGAAAAAAMQAIGQQGAAAGGAPGAEGAKPKKGESDFDRPLTAPQIKKTSGGEEKKHGTGKKGAASKAKPSKYKSRDLTEKSEHVYRFNDKAEALDDPAKTKDSAKPKKSSSETDERERKPGACSSEEPCSAKDPDADAL